MEAACLGIDAILRRLPALRVSTEPGLPFDSVWPGAGTRTACRVRGAGHFTGKIASFDSLLTRLGEAGRSGNIVFSADGPDGTIQGYQRGGVTCILRGEWDGGDEADSTYQPSDTLEIDVSCAQSVASDTAINS